MFYKIIEKKYFEKLEMKNIEEETNLTNDEIKYIDMKFREDIVNRFNEEN